MDTVNIDGKHYEIADYDHNGTPIIQGHATSVHHKDENGQPIYDKDGYPKVSVHISVSPTAEPVDIKTNEEKAE